VPLLAEPQNKGEGARLKGGGYGACAWARSRDLDDA